MALAIISANQTLYGKFVSNILCFDNIQEDSTWLQDFADEFRSAANNRWDNVMVVGWTLDNLTFSFIEGDHISYSVNVDFTLGDLIGNDLSGGMPGGSTALISTSFTGPKPNRGRVYFSGIGEVNQSNGTWSGTAMVELKALVELWIAGFQVQGSNTSLQILRRPSTVFPTYIANPVQFANRRDNTTSQRRRNLGRD